jgi:hypothetical protein
MLEKGGESLGTGMFKRDIWSIEAASADEATPIGRSDALA